jgi:hypothetical protein
MGEVKSEFVSIRSCKRIHREEVREPRYGRDELQVPIEEYFLRLPNFLEDAGTS